MDRRTRMFNAMDGKPVDRAPTTFYTHFQSPEDQADNTVSGQAAFCKAADMDALCVETDGYMEYPLNFTPKRAADWRQLRPQGLSSAYIQGQIDRSRRIIDALRGEYGMFFMVFTPFSTIKHTVGEDMAMAHYAEDRDALVEAMKVIEEDTLLLCRALMEDGQADGLFLSMQNGERERFSVEEYQGYLTEWDERLIACANEVADHVILHLCSWCGVPNHLQLWKDYDFTTANYAPGIEQLSLAEGRKFFPGKTLMGGFATGKEDVLYAGDEAAVKAATRAILQEAGPERFILSCDCSVEPDIDPLHLRWVAEAAAEYGMGQ